MLNFHSIKFRIIALGLMLILLGVLVRQFIALPMLQKDVQELVASQQLSIATYVARDIDQKIASNLELIERFAAELPPELVSQPQKLQVWIKDRQRISPAFTNGLLVVRPDGLGLLAEYPVVRERNQRNYSSADWFLAALRSSKPAMGKPLRESANEDPVIVFAVPVRDPGGKQIAVLAGSTLLNASGFLDRIQESQLGGTGGFLLVSPADQMFVASSDPAMALKPTPPTGVNLLHDRAMSGFRGTGVTINAKGVEELSAIASVPSAGWFVVARLPTAEAFRPVDALRGFIFKANILLAASILLTLIYILSRIFRPLIKSSRAIRDMADGKTELAPLPVVRKDEVGILVEGFNVLVGRLRSEQKAREESEAQLRYMAHHDSLTGLYNRATLEDRLEQALIRAERDGSEIALLFCDLDGFKTINDEHGHNTGDEVLRQVAARLRDGRRRMDTVARLGGDEFIILLTGLSDARAAALGVARQCLAAVGEAFEFNDTRFSLGVSIGIAIHAGSAIAPSYMIAQADLAMYQAKRRGKGIFFFTEEARLVVNETLATTEAGMSLPQTRPVPE